MSRQSKLITRLLIVPNDFTCDELIKVLAGFGYAELNGRKNGRLQKEIC